MLELYLNPTEVVSKKLLVSCNTIIDLLADATSELVTANGTPVWRQLDIQFKTKKRELMYYQQVILKSEWKRVKKETDKGEQLSNQEMLQIFKEVGESLNATKYNSYLKTDLESVNILH